MITALRRVFVDSWFGRVLAFLFFAAFVVWGMGGLVTDWGSGTAENAVVRVGSRDISPDALNRGIQDALPAVAQQLGLPDAAQLSRSQRADAVHQVLQRMIAQQELLLVAQHNGMQAPDALVRQDVFAMPYFKGSDGRFDRAIFNERINRAGYSEGSFLDSVRDEIVTRGLGAGLGDSVQAPKGLIQRILDFNARQYVLDLVRVDAASLPAPAAPTDADLHRYYDNHPWAFSTHEFRHARVVVLTAETIAHAMDVPEETLHRLYDLQSQRFHVPVTRHLEVMTFQDAAQAGKAAAAWKSGQSWSAMQDSFKDAAAVDMPGTRKSDVPNPDLAEAAFAAPQGEIEGPLKTETGWAVFRVIDIAAPHDTSFSDARDDLRGEITKAQAPQLLQARVERLQDAVAASADLSRIPSDIDAVPVEGALDAGGLTQTGEPAPLPGSDALRKQIIGRIFSQGTGDKPSVVRGPDGSAFALVVTGVEPGHVIAFDEARGAVLAAWTRDARRHAADIRATALFSKAKAGGGVARAVVGTEDAQRLQTGVTFSRMQAPDLPRALLARAMQTPPGNSLMINDGDDYYVATLTGTRAPDPQASAELSHRLAPEITSSLHSDVETAYFRALEGRVPPKPNMALLKKVIDSGSGGQ